MNTTNSKQRMNVAAALDSNYVRYTYVMLTSLLMNQEADTDIHIYLLQSDLTAEEKESLESLVSLYEGQLYWLTVDRGLFSADYLAIPTGLWKPITGLCFRISFLQMWIVSFTWMWI